MTETPTAENPAKNKSVGSLPFTIASRAMTRFSYSFGTTTLGTGMTPLPIGQIPAVGYLRKLQLKVTIAATGGTGFPGDMPFNILSSIRFNTASGNPLLVPSTGYDLYLMNKYAHPQVMSPYSDPKYISYSTTSGTAATFYLDIPFEIDPETALGSIPALASNRSYQLNISLAPYTSITAATGATVNIEALAYYWSEPPATSAAGISQESQPQGLGTINQWQLDTVPLTPGDHYLKLNNTGNFMRAIIFVLRNSAGARVDADWPGLSEIYLDNEPLFYLLKADWQRMMRQQFGLAATAMDAANGLDTGVFVLPFDALTGSLSGDPANTRSQYLPTLDSSQLQIRGTSFGAGASTLQILTNSVIPQTSADIYSK